MLELHGIAASYGPARVLFDVSLVVPEGQVAALVGRNGAGKTTTMRVASGLLRPDAGEILLDGDPLQGRSADAFVAAGCLHVPEGRGIFPGLSVRENLAVGAHRLGMRRRSLDAAIDRVAATFPRLVERMEQRAGSLSGGEQQMLAIARGLMGEPRVLIIDEPSLGLAPVVVDEVYRLIRELRSRGTTIVLVEQYVERALDVSDRTYLLEKGRVVRAGTSAELRDDPTFLDAYMLHEEELTA